MITLRRFLSVFALMFWQGGFMFYAAVVVPILRARLEKPGLITQEVTQWMNLIGTLAVLLMFADLYASPIKPKLWRWVAWLGMALPQPILVWMHREMTRQMAAPDFYLMDMSAFQTWHRVYLLHNTVQWFAGMAFTVLSLRAWRAEDGLANLGESTAPAPPTVADPSSERA